MNTTKMNKVILSAAVLAAITGTALAGGVNNTITGQFGADAVGTQNTVTGSSAFTAGYNNNVSGNNAVSYGVSNKATGINSIAGGEYSYAKGRNSVAIGSSAQALQDNTFAIGSQARANGEDALAFGNGAYSENKSTVAVGHSVNATGKYSVAIGSGNKAEGEAAVNIGSNNHGAYDHATIVGSENNIAYSDHMVDPYGDVVVGTKNTLQDSYFSIAVGNNNALSNADNSVAIGNNTSVSVAESVAIGHEAKADTVVGTSSASIGGTTYNFAGSTPVGTVSVGDVSKERTLTNVAAGRISDTSTDAVNGSQLHAVATEAAKHTVVTAGNNINVTSGTATNGGTKYTVALSNDLSVNSAAFGANTDPIHNVIDKNGVAVFNGDVDAHYNANGVSIEDRNTLDNAQYDLNGMVADSNGKRVEFTTTNITAGGQQIHGVAAGTAGTDAVNMSQLTSALNQVNGNTNALSNMVKANQQEARKGIAGTAALAGLHPLDFDPDHKLDIMAGYGHFHGTNAGAVGVAYRPNEDLMFTVGTTFGSDNVINAGVSYKVGAKSEVSRSKVALIKDLDEAKKEIAQLKADNEKIKAILEKVLGEQAADLK